MRLERSLASARLAVLEWAGRTLGFMEGPRTRGPKPQRKAEVELELQEAVHQIELSAHTEHGSSKSTGPVRGSRGRYYFLPSM